jgi:AcrR family transcriptional regulator
MNTEEAKWNIILTAQTLFLQDGIKKVSMEVIAREGHISKKTIYLYFKNKKDLLDALFGEMEVRLIEQIDKKQAEINPVASVFFIYQAVLKETSPFLNDSSLKHCYSTQHEHLTGMLFTLFKQTVKVQIQKGIHLGFYIPGIKTDEFCFLLTNALLYPIIEPALMSQKFNMHLSAKDIIYYSLRSVVTPLGLKTLEQNISLVESPATVS